tara:strand:+ start:10186 stop:10989 length:804 start_codon:yes stop_codon:yes gene_type:complete
MKYIKKLIDINITQISLIFFISVCLSASASAVELKEHEASYVAKIKKGVSLKGKATRSLKKIQGNKWLYRFDVESFIADIKESTVLIERNQDIKPIQYDYKLSAFLMSDRKRKVKFDWEKQTAINPLKNNDWKLTAIPDNTYDQLSYQLQLLLDVSNNKTNMTYQLAHKAKLRESQFVVLGEEVIDTRFGKLKSISAKKQRDDDAKRETYLWFSADYPLLLLKMTQKEKDGEEYEIELSSAVIDGEKINLSEKAITDKETRKENTSN